MISAALVTTSLTWDDLVLPDDVMSLVGHINTWIRKSTTILGDWGLGRHVKPGYRSLFIGPPGTGKTLTATLIGAEAGIDVCRVDLSAIVSKYIGETDKALAHVFEQAQDGDRVLFFDEADALFAKRTESQSANDRHAHQHVACLLQRIADFPGVAIFAADIDANFDAAFIRRFQSVIYFPMPDVADRLRLWRGVVGEKLPLDPDVDLEQFATRYMLSGGDIVNIVRYAATNALNMGRNSINTVDLTRGIRRELSRRGKTA